MNLGSLFKFVKDALVDLAGRAVEGFARAVADWVMERVERLATSVADRLRRYADDQRRSGVSEERLGTRITDTLVDTLDTLRADLVRRREHLSAEELLSMFEQQLALPQLA